MTVAQAIEILKAVEPCKCPCKAITLQPNMFEVEALNVLIAHAESGFVPNPLAQERIGVVDTSAPQFDGTYAPRRII